MPAWEYRVELFDTDRFRDNEFRHLDIDALNKLGGEGWELVSSDSLIDATGGGFAVGQAKTMRIALWFKRPVSPWEPT